MLNRRQMLTMTALGAGVLAMPHIARAKGPEFTFKYANNLPITHPMNLEAKAAALRIKEQTDGRFELQVFPNNQLGSDTDMLSQLRAGGIEFFTLSGLILSTLVPLAAISNLGFIFPDYAAVWKAMDGGLGAFIREQIAKVNLHPMEKIWDNGFRQTTTSTVAIETPDNFRGLKIRVPPSPILSSMFRTLGASPVAMNFAEVYSSLQTKVIDAQENPLAVISTAKLYEVQKYLSLTNHAWDGYWFLANGRAWRRLPDDLKEIVANNINQAGMAERVQVEKLNIDLAEGLKNDGMSVNSVDTTPFREALRAGGFYEEWKGKYGDAAWDVLENYTGKLI
ncbi:TRAP transporter substrate-binding protein [Xanthobacter sp. TB0136]|uniref:TRAP transporter substrate-binding protein n=1 Tax=Xanthobacter sp. TB0136 TaxID=3459177 RepID=UPI00403913BC